MRLKQAVLAVPFVIVMANQGRADVVCTLSGPLQNVYIEIETGYGTVQVDINGLVQQAKSSMPLHIGDTLLTGNDGSAQIKMDDTATPDTECRINVSPNSNLSLYGSDGKFVADLRKVKLPAGGVGNGATLGALLGTLGIAGGVAVIVSSNSDSPPMSNQ